MEEITTVGVDLAKEVFAICILDARGAVLERKVLRRVAFERWAGALPRCTVAMEACGSAHHWGRTFAARGHTARLIPAEFVVPFRQGGKNDGNDALAIAIAARQPTMRFVPIKTVEQQAILSWHRARAGFNDERTALINRLRGLLAEFGIVIAQSSERLLKALPGLCVDEGVPISVRALLLEAREQFAALHARLERCDVEIAAHARENQSARRLREVLGVGVLTASAFAATVPDPTVFRHGRQLGAWLGLTAAPTQLRRQDAAGRQQPARPMRTCARCSCRVRAVHCRWRWPHPPTRPRTCSAGSRRCMRARAITRR